MAINSVFCKKERCKDNRLAPSAWRCFGDYHSDAWRGREALTLPYAMLPIWSAVGVNQLSHCPISTLAALAALTTTRDQAIMKGSSPALILVAAGFSVNAMAQKSSWRATKRCTANLNDLQRHAARAARLLLFCPCFLFCLSTGCPPSTRPVLPKSSRSQQAVGCRMVRYKAIPPTGAAK